MRRSTPEVIVRPLLDPRDAEALRIVALREIGAGITPQRIQQFVSRFLNGNVRLHASELPPDFYADMQWAIFALAYGHHPEVQLRCRGRRTATRWRSARIACSRSSW